MTERFHSKSEAARRLMILARQNGWDDRPLSVALELADFLDTLADAGEPVDRGVRNGSAALWVSIGGVRYVIEISPADCQLKKEGWSQEAINRRRALRFG